MPRLNKNKDELIQKIRTMGLYFDGIQDMRVREICAFLAMAYETGAPSDVEYCQTEQPNGDLIGFPWDVGNMGNILLLEQNGHTYCFSRMDFGESKWKTHNPLAPGMLWSATNQERIKKFLQPSVYDQTYVPKPLKMTENSYALEISNIFKNRLYTNFVEPKNILYRTEIRDDNPLSTIQHIFDVRATETMSILQEILRKLKDDKNGVYIQSIFDILNEPIPDAIITDRVVHTNEIASIEKICDITIQLNKQGAHPDEIHRLRGVRRAMVKTLVESGVDEDAIYDEIERCSK